MNSKKFILFAVAIVLAVTIATVVMGGGREGQTDRNKVTVAASYYPLYDFARQVGGDKVTVTNLTPAGTEPHDFDPSPKALADAQKANVFVYNGGTFEPWTKGFAADYPGVAVKASQDINLLHQDESDHQDGHESGDHADEQAQDPHFWLDPVLARQVVNNIRDGLSKADPANRASYEQNAAKYNDQLAQLNTEFSNGLQTCQHRTIITSHQAFSYLGKRYNLQIESIAGLSPQEDPSAAKMAQLSRLVKDTGIKYIFFESLASPRLADTIASETGAKTLVLDPIEGLTDADQQQGKDYLSVQRQNLANLKTALACQ